MISEKRFGYFVPNCGGSEEDAYFICDEHKLKYCNNLRDFIDLIVEDFFDNHDGWEVEWPVDFIVVDFEEIKKYKVTIEME